VSWIFDYYPVPGGMAVWLLDGAGRARRLVDPWTPVFHADGRPPARAFARAGLRVDLSLVERIEFYSGRPRRVTAVRVLDPLQFSRAARLAARFVPPERLYDVDLPPAQLYGYDRGIYPLARVDERLRPLASAWETDYALPPIRVLEIGLEGGTVNPAHAGRRRAALELRFDGTTEVLDPDGAVEALDARIRRLDPDLIATRWGDECLLPLLERAGVCFHRDPEAAPRHRERRAYFTYGKLGYSGGTRSLLGRWHLDLENSFLLREAGIDGLIDLARLTKIPVQHLARCTVGTAITSMQLDRAYRDGVLIPSRKRQTEGYKTAAELLDADKGGLTYLPPVGFFERVGELDFASMYPTIMARFNISPETINCGCCAGRPVPEIGHRVCTRRRGLVPRVLEPILERRVRYKALRDAAADPVAREMYDRRQTALKWCLVCCFGYLGFRNARFGKIEAHEAVTAYSRELLLRAKEIAESRGYAMLHAIVDSLWVTREAPDFAALADEIARRTGMPISYEGTYRWIGFLPARTRPRVAVHNRYCGAFESGTLKVRGLELRRHDTPRIVRELQRELLEYLAPARDLAELRARAASAVEIVEAHARRVREGPVSPADLAIARTLSRAPREYRQNTLTAVAARQLAACGVELMAGERVAYVVMDEKNPAAERRAIALVLTAQHWEHDPRYYEALLRRAADSILGPLNPKPAPPAPSPSLPLFAGTKP
jgi:DNA polymerase elongation subunit (family B)